MWLEMIDYGRIAWERTMADVNKLEANPVKSAQRITQFKTLWCRQGVFATWDSEHPCWNFLGLRFSIVS